MSRLTKLSTLTAAILLATGAGTAMAADGPIKIGVQAPITGEYAAEGQGIQNGVQLLVKQQNAAGGLLGRQIQVIVCDDEGKASQAAICGRKLVNDGVIAVIAESRTGSPQRSAPAATAPWPARASRRATSRARSSREYSRGRPCSPGTLRTRPRLTYA